MRTGPTHMPTASETPNQAARPIGTHDHAFMPRLLPSGRPMKYRTFTVRLWFICTTAPPACQGRRAPPMGPRPRSCRDLHHTGRQPGGAAQYTARRPDARLAAAGRLPILGRLWAPGAFLRVPQERPAKHQPDHYRRGEPGGQADQHPRPRAHPAPQAAHPGHRPCPLPINTTSRADPLRPNAATGPRYVHALAPRPVPRRPAARRRHVVHGQVPGARA